MRATRRLIQVGGGALAVAVLAARAVFAAEPAGTAADVVLDAEREEGWILGVG